METNLVDRGEGAVCLWGILLKLWSSCTPAWARLSAFNPPNPAMLKVICLLGPAMA